MIGNSRDYRISGACFNQRFQYQGNVTSRPGRDVISRVGNKHGVPGLADGTPHGFLDRHRRRIRRKSLTLSPDFLGHAFRVFPGCRTIFRDHNRGDGRKRRIRPCAPDHNRRVDNVGTRFHLLKSCVQGPRRLHPRGRVFPRQQHGQPDNGIHRADIFLYASDQVSDRAHLCLGPVHVGCGPQRRQHIGLLHDLWREIGVQVQTGDDRTCAAYRLAHTTNQVAFPVAHAFHFHCAVQIQVHAVHRQCPTQTIHQLGRHRLVRVPENEPMGLRPGNQRRRPFNVVKRLPGSISQNLVPAQDVKILDSSP